MSEEAASSEQATDAPAWQPLGKIDRRVLGVLVEKAKTTPDQYPLSLNALKAGCNQKSNRDPVMDLDEETLTESLERLRGLGAVTEVYGGGRVSRYRHHMYQWLGVDAVELAVMTELLLRGAQTEGELRGRAARMEPIRDVAALRPVIESLKSKNLLISLSPEGRGHVVTHALYQPRELEALRSQYSGIQTAPPEPDYLGVPAPRDASRAAAAPPAPNTARSAMDAGEVASLRAEVAELRSQLATIRDELEQLAAARRSTDEDISRVKQELGL